MNNTKKPKESASKYSEATPIEKLVTLTGVGLGLQRDANKKLQAISESIDSIAIGVKLLIDKESSTPNA